MPTLPSGRRIEFSLDRFHALLDRMERRQAQVIAGNLGYADDLLFVMDAVHFSLQDGTPYFAGYMAADWATVAADWSTADRQALQAWFASPAARSARVEAIEYIKEHYEDRPGRLPYPYLVQDGMCQAGVMAGSMLRQ